MAKTMNKKAEQEEQKRLETVLLAKPTHCPFCGKDNAYQSDAPENARLMDINMECDDCKSTWIEHYHLTSASNFKKGHKVT